MYVILNTANGDLIPAENSVWRIGEVTETVDGNTRTIANRITDFAYAGSGTTIPSPQPTTTHTLGYIGKTGRFVGITN